MNTKIEQIIGGFTAHDIPQNRKLVLQPLVDYIFEKRKAGKKVLLNFICTHNSRRSHFSQIWAQTMAYWFNINNISCFSGGTEATALFSGVVDALKTQGFDISKFTEEENPVYFIKFHKNEVPIIGFSKRFDDKFNPESEFCAIMTCSSADAGCPFILGADKRIPIQYDDPKIFDGTLEMANKYLEESVEIAQEMYYVFQLWQIRQINSIF